MTDDLGPSWQRSRALLMGVALAASGVLPMACVQNLSLEGRACDCTAGFDCCKATNKCVRPDELAKMVCDPPDPLPPRVTPGPTDAALPLGNGGTHGGRGWPPIGTLPRDGATPPPQADVAPPTAPDAVTTQPPPPDARDAATTTQPPPPDARDAATTTPPPPDARDAATTTPPPPDAHDAAPPPPPPPPPDGPPPDVGAPDRPVDRQPDLPMDMGQPPCPNGGGAVSARYYPWVDNPPPPATAREPGLILDWGARAPHPARAADFFTTKLAAELTPEATDNYTFFVEADDWIRLWVGGELVVDWVRSPTKGPMAANKRLEAGVRYPLFVEHWESVGDARISVTWKRPSTPAGPIPACLLRPLEAEPPRCSTIPLSDCIPVDVPPCGAGQGLTADYFRERTLTREEHEHTESNSELYFVWPFLRDPSTVQDRYRVRWEGYLEAPTTDRYTFFIVSDRYVRLYIAGREGGSESDEGTYHEGILDDVPLVAGQRYPVRVEAHEATPAHAPMLQIRWKAATMPKSSIPRCRFFPPNPPIPPPPDAGAGR